MLKRPARQAILAALFITLAFLFAKPAMSAQADPVRIMPLGDSITGSPGCWRAILWNKLQSAGYTNIDFVGTLPPQGCALPYDGDNEGHAGFLVTNVAKQNLLPGWLAATRPDIVLMHFGTNDVWNAIPPTTILDAYSILVDQMRASNPSMKVIVAQIIPMNPSNCPECAQRITALNALIPGWASAKSTAQSPIIVVDQWTGFNTSTDTYDGVHPNDAGDRKMADKWYPALAGLLTPAPPTGTPTEPGPQPACAVTYRIGSSWGSGFTADVTVKNNGPAINGWTLAWNFPGSQTITNLWNGQFTQSGPAVSVRNASYNGSIPTGGSVNFGFQAAGPAATPSSFTLNGVTCG